MSWHYTCNNKTFFNKFDSIKEFVDSNKPIYYHEPLLYENYPMHIEPGASWQELCKNYALKIRDEYDYIRIWYSGGCDSQTVLDSFIQNNIYVDEIICNKCGIKEADFELDQYAIPYLTKIKHLIPNTKINISTVSSKEYESFYNKPYWYEELAIKRANEHFHFRMNNMNESYERYKQVGKTANITGKEKPQLVYNKGRWYTYFLDINMEQQPTQVNFFVDNPEIHAKQCHMLLKAIKKNIPFDDFNRVTNYSKYQEFWNKHSGRFTIGTLFPKKNINLENEKLQLNKNDIYYRTNKEKIALKVMLNARPELVKKWKSKLDDFAELANGKWFNNGRPEMGTVGVFSKFYCLDMNDVKTVDDLYPNGFFL